MFAQDFQLVKTANLNRYVKLTVHCLRLYTRLCRREYTARKRQIQLWKRKFWIIYRLQIMSMTSFCRQKSRLGRFSITGSLLPHFYLWLNQKDPFIKSSHNALTPLLFPPFRIVFLYFSYRTGSLTPPNMLALKIIWRMWQVWLYSGEKWSSSRDTYRLLWTFESLL